MMLTEVACAMPAMMFDSMFVSVDWAVALPKSVIDCSAAVWSDIASDGAPTATACMVAMSAA